MPALGGRKLHEMTAGEVDRWLEEKAGILSSSTLATVYGCLNRAVTRAMARDKVKRNVVALCQIPTGQPGRPSKSLTFPQAQALLDSAKTSLFYAYIVLSLLIGARTEELRALTWTHVDLLGNADTDPPIPPHIEVWRSVREGGDTKTKKSRRTLALPQRCVDALHRHRKLQERKREQAGPRWHNTDLVFCTGQGEPLLAGNVRRTFRRLCRKAGIGDDWTPRELRHSFVSLLSDNGVPLEAIADLVGHSGTTVTERVYRHQLRPVLLGGAVAMDKIFGVRPGDHEA